jgi:hypothetical protein
MFHAPENECFVGKLNAAEKKFQGYFTRNEKEYPDGRNAESPLRPRNYKSATIGRGLYPRAVMGKTNLSHRKNPFSSRLQNNRVIRTAARSAD